MPGSRSGQARKPSKNHSDHHEVILDGLDLLDKVILPGEIALLLQQCAHLQSLRNP